MPAMSPIWLLVTTSRSLLLLDGTSGRGYRLDGGRGLYYGLAPRGDRTYVAARNRLASSAVPAAEERGQILVLDADLACGCRAATRHARVNGLAGLMSGLRERR